MHVAPGGRWARTLMAATALTLAVPAAAQAPAYVPPDAPPRYHPLPPVRQQAEEMQTWVAARLVRVLPALMAEHGVDMWILSMREYGEDPVFWSMIAPTTFAARRRSIYVFTRRPDGSVERLALGGTSQGGLFEIYSSPHPTPTGRAAELWGDEQWRLLHEIVADRNPSNIVLNIDDTWAFSDGLGAGEREALEKALGPEYVKRVKRVPQLAVEYIAHPGAGDDAPLSGHGGDGARHHLRSVLQLGDHAGGHHHGGRGVVAHARRSPTWG